MITDFDRDERSEMFGIDMDLDSAINDMIMYQKRLFRRLEYIILRYLKDGEMMFEDLRNENSHTSDYDMKKFEIRAKETCDYFLAKRSQVKELYDISGSLFDKLSNLLNECREKNGKDIKAVDDEFDALLGRNKS